MIGQTISHYRILEKLGEGGMGVVYKAEDTKLRRTVALKFLPAQLASENRERFLREAQAAAALNHPNICTVFEIDEQNGFLAMEFIEGASVREKIASRPLPLEEALEIAMQACAGLQVAHEKGVVHRDIKPANLMLTAAGQVKITDFGLAQVGDRTRITKTGSSLGTPAYMSPEQAKGDVVDRRTDIWSLGVVLYEMVSGRLPFRGETEQAVSYGIVHSEPEPLTALRTGLPPELDRIVAKAIAKDPGARYQHVDDLRVDLTSVVTFRAATVPHASRSWIYAAGGAIGALAAAAILLAIPSLREVITAGVSSLPAQARIRLIGRYTGTERDCALSPDGKYFAFVSEMGGSPDIWVRQVTGGELIRLSNDTAIESTLTYAPDGQSIYYSSRAAIWRIGALGGNPRKIADGASNPSLSADGKRLAYLKGDVLEIANPDGTGASKVADTLGWQGRASLSPDGTQIAFTRGNLFDTVQLFVVEAAGKSERQLTHFSGGSGGTGAVAHTWLPDSRHILFSRNQDLWITSAEGGEHRRLTLNYNGQFQSLSLSADGRRLIASLVENEYEVWQAPLGSDPETNGRTALRLLDNSGGPMWIYKHPASPLLLINSWSSGVRNLWVHTVDGSGVPRQITEVENNAVTHSSLSPDGFRVSYSSLETGNAEIWVRNTDGSNPVQLTNDPASDFWPIWSADGKWLVFGSLRGGSAQLWKIPAAGGAAVRLTKETGVRADLSPAGDRIVYASERLPGLLADTREGIFGARQLQVADFDGNIALRIPWPDADIALPMWSPDGKRFSAIRRESPLNHSVWIFDAQTGQGRIAVRFPGRFHMIFRACWTSDGKSVIVNRAESVSRIVLLENFQ